MTCLQQRLYLRVQRGVTLIELLVAMVISLVLTLAVTSIVIVGESHKRTTTSTNDTSQSGAYAMVVLDRALRSAGSGFVQAANRGAFGCRLHAGTMLPRTTAFPAPFAAAFLTGATGTLRVAPVLIAKNQSDAGSDVLVVMRGNGATGDVPRRLTDIGDATTLRLDSTVGFGANDVALVSQSGIDYCLITQVASAAGSAVTLNPSGTYYTAGTDPATLASLTGSTSTYVSLLGNASAGNVQFQLFGVGANRTLFSYDLMHGDGDASLAVADSVVELHAIYGLDTNEDGILDAWASPSDTGYDVATVMATPATIKRIVAVRIALILRNTNYEKEMVAAHELPYFQGVTNASGTSLAGKLTLAASATTENEARHFRYRVIESTIPIRNMLLQSAL